MGNSASSTRLSPLRAELTSFERCYAVAIQQRAASGRIQFIVRTGDAFRPFRVSARPPGRGEQITTLVA
ncbi:MAG: hypothetical protein H2055_06885 [Sphingopyxis sp.]|nr:hypothetical protein [Sphingopyxis sp.]